MDNRSPTAAGNQSPSKLVEISSLLLKNEGRYMGPEFISVARVGEDSLKPVFPAYQDLNEAVDGLDTRIGRIVKQKHESYVHSYRDEMMLVQKELMEIRRKYEEFMVKQDDEEKMDELERHITEQKAEVVKLDKLLLRKEEEIKALKSKVSFLKEERKFLGDYIANTVRKNKLISLDRHVKPPASVNSSMRASSNPRRITERRAPSEKSRILDMSCQDDKNGIFKLSNISIDMYNQDLSNVYFETGLSQLDEFLNKLKDQDFGDKIKILKDIETFCKGVVVNSEKKTHITRNRIEREKVKLEAVINSKLLAQTELATIFEDCLKKVKIRIEKRRLAGLILGKEGSELAEKKAVDFMRGVKIEYKDFLTKDKEKVLENFVSDDTVINVMKYLISTGKGLGAKYEALNGDQSQTKGVDDTILNSLESSILEPTNMSQHRRKTSVSSTGLMGQNTSLGLPKLKEDPEEKHKEKENDFVKNDRKATVKKIEQLMGSESKPAPSGVNQLRMRDVTKHYKI